MPRLKEIAKEFGKNGNDTLTVQVTGPIDFQPEEAAQRLHAFDVLRKAGLNPVLRLITDEFRQGGDVLSNPESIKMVVDYIIENKLNPREVLETPLHLDPPWAKRKDPSPQGIQFLAQKLQDLYKISGEDAEAQARNTIYYNLTRYVKPKLAGGGERYLGLTYDSLRKRLS